MPNIEPLLKFEADFLDEDAIQPDSPHYSTITMIHQPRPLGRKRKRATSPRHLDRTSSLRFTSGTAREFSNAISLLPSSGSGWKHPGTMSALRERGVKDWQAEQAVANLLLSDSICHGQLFYADGLPEDLATRIGRALQQREERSDTPELTRFSTQDIITQVQLDAVALLRLEGQAISISSGSDSLQKRLASLNLLEPPNA